MDLTFKNFDICRSIFKNMGLIKILTFMWSIFKSYNIGLTFENYNIKFNIFTNCDN